MQSEEESWPYLQGRCSPSVLDSCLMSLRTHHILCLGLRGDNDLGFSACGALQLIWARVSGSPF